MSAPRCWMVPNITTEAFNLDGSFRVGAMGWRTHERSERDTDPRPMPHLAVMSPVGLICLDCPATADPPGRYWLRVGDPPNITVTPSLNIANLEWHGWLQEGAFVGGGEHG